MLKKHNFINSTNINIVSFYFFLEDKKKIYTIKTNNWVRLIKLFINQHFLTNFGKKLKIISTTKYTIGLRIDSRSFFTKRAKFRAKIERKKKQKREKKQKQKAAKLKNKKGRDFIVDKPKKQTGEVKNKRVSKPTKHVSIKQRLKRLL